MAQLPSIGPAVAPPGAASPLDAAPWAQAAASASAHAPYLNRLLARRVDLLVDADAMWSDRLQADALATADAIAAEPPDMETGMAALRRAKQAVHLGVAIADLARAWPLDRVTGALTDFADASLRAALALAAREMARRGDIAPPETGPHGPVTGFALIAMGKMGAHELNYSSDIDFSIFFDASVMRSVREPRVAAVRLVAPLVRALEEITPDGYVFRTDLRLRPDPGSTPVAVAIESAERYYQSLGQNWERAAFIKARVAAGDIPCGESFLADLTPFIWRKHLDFAAVADVHSIKRQILSAHKSAELHDPIFDVKLGRGGIRDIELFAQTQQLILGGRNRALRAPRTLDALRALAEARAISEETAAALVEAYVFFREVEHRIQMLEDAQTHRVPADPETRAHLAALCGFEDVSVFEKALVARREIVSEIDHALFGASESLADPLGSLIFTGVEDDPETLRTIAQLGYADPATISQTIRGWHHGRIRAMRSERARELLTALTPRLLRAFSQTGEPDQAFARFAAFFANLAAGVQVLSLLSARPALLDTLARLLALAPRLALALARRPALLDAMIEPRFAQRLANDPPRRADLRARLDEAKTFEQKLNIARRFRHEEAFRIDVQVLERAATAAEAGAAHADLAEACVAEMADAARAETERLYGPAQGAYCVLALGKFGGRELAEGSDLDIMVVYEAPDEARDFYARLTQRLISAISSPTEEGELYEVDMQLRPSGSKGPVAVRLSSFAHYYQEEAWTWELQALTRLRPVAGDDQLSAEVMRVASAALQLPRDETKLRADIADMRTRMERERPAKGAWDLKLAPGGMVDLEFIVQALQLMRAPHAPAVVSANTGDALARLARAGVLSAADRAALEEAWMLYGALQQVLRICVEGEFNPDEAPVGLKHLLASLADAADFAALETKLESLRVVVRRLFRDVVGG
ncbi:MAG: bifunctional [glutamine synthetase] adenylyltransferase/[glutamine synthetase]-adenylyl-L-tyrosine phosphorylase [Pseudomonadota bacterium]